MDLLIVYITTVVVLTLSFIVGLVLIIKDKKKVPEKEEIISTNNKVEEEINDDDQVRDNNHGFDSVPNIDVSAPLINDNVSDELNNKDNVLIVDKNVSNINPKDIDNVQSESNNTSESMVYVQDILKARANEQIGNSKLVSKEKDLQEKNEEILPENEKEEIVAYVRDVLKKQAEKQISDNLKHTIIEEQADVLETTEYFDEPVQDDEQVELHIMDEVIEKEPEYFEEPVIVGVYNEKEQVVDTELI